MIPKTISVNLLLLSAFCLSNAQDKAISSAPSPKKVLNYVFKSNTNGYHTYRIPSIVQTKTGVLLAFAEGRVHNWGDHGDIDIVARRSTDGGKTWSDLIIVQDDGKATCGNPVPVVDYFSNGRIVLLSCGSSTGEGAIMNGNGTREVYVQFSDDDGKTWTKRKNISKQVKQDNWRWYATGPCSGIQLTQGKHKGRLVIPANHSDEHKVYRSHCFYSDDGGKNWKLGQSAGEGSNESQIVEIDSGHMVQNMRMQTHGKGVRGIRSSSDGGQTWTELTHDTNLPCPRCQASIVRDPSGDGVLYFSNPATTPGKREGMSIRTSTDNGKTWPYVKPVFPGPSGYSNLVVMKNSRVGLLYEGGYKDLADGIIFESFSRKDLQQNIPNKNTP